MNPSMSQHILDLIGNELTSNNLEESIVDVDIAQSSSRSCLVVAQLTNKYHRKKIKERIAFNDVDAGIEHLIYQISSYVDTGYTMRYEDMYVMLVSINDIPIGYSCEPTGSWGQYWVTLKAAPDDRRVRTFENIPQSKLTQIVNYYPTEYRLLSGSTIYSLDRRVRDEASGNWNSLGAGYCYDSFDGCYEIWCPERDGFTWTYELVPADSPTIDQTSAITRLISNLPEFE